ncbi:MAG: hypothetical protein V4857_14405 [Pseudomonadota bacterium]
MSAKPAAVAPLPDWLPAEAWAEYLAMRKKNKRPMTPYAEKLAIGKLTEFRANGQDVQAVLEQSIFNSWQGLFAVKVEPAQQMPARGGRPVLALADQQRANNEAAKRKLFGQVVDADFFVVDEGHNDAR